MSETDAVRIARLEAAVATFGRIETKIDQIAASSAAVAQQVASLEQAHRSHSSGLERAFGEVKEIRDEVEKMRREREVAAAERAREIGDIRERVATEERAREVGEAAVKASVRTGMWFVSGIGGVVLMIAVALATKVFAVSDAIIALQGKVG